MRTERRTTEGLGEVDSVDIIDAGIRLVMMPGVWSLLQ